MSTRMSPHRLKGPPSRRRLLKGMSAGAAATAFLAACGGDDKPSGGTTGSSATTTSGGGGAPAAAAAPLPGQLTEAEKAQAKTVETEYRLKYHYSKLQNLPGQKQGPKAGGVFRNAYTPPVSFDVLDPGSGTDSYAGSLYNGLVDMPSHDFADVHRGIRPTPDLAEKWEQPEPEVIVFTLHEGVKFQNKPPVNGREMTVEDVRQSYEAYRKAPYQGPNYADVKSIEAVDKRRIKFTFNKPAAYFLNNLLSQRHVVVPPEILGTERMKTDAIGTGSMMLKSWKPNESMEMEKNPTHFKKDPRTGMQLPYWDSWRSTVYGDRNSLLAAWRGGQLDHISLQAGLKEIKAIGVETDPNAVLQVVSPSTWGMNHIAFKLEKAPWSDVRVRRALSLALNRREMVDGLVDGLGAEGSYALDWTFFKDAKTGEFQEFPWRLDQLGQYQKYDPGQAKQLLEAAGFNNRNPLEFEVVGLSVAEPRQQVQLAAVDMWKQALGEMVKPKFVGVETLAYGRIQRTREYNDVYFAWTAGPAYEPDGFLYAQLNSKSSFAYYGIKDADIDRLTEAQRVELDNAKRQPLWQQVMDKDLDQVYRAFTFISYKTMARRANVFNVLDVMHAWPPGYRGAAQWGWKLP
jgi:peptide/nickel transport system substrate-binding protein